MTHAGPLTGRTVSRSTLRRLKLPALRELARQQGLPDAGRQSRAQLMESLSAPPLEAPDHHRLTADEIQVEPAGSRWLHVRWSFCSATLARAASSMGRAGARHAFILRVHRVELDDTGPRSRQHDHDVHLPEDISEWYLPLPGGESAWIVELGFLYGKSRFFSLVHSIPVTLPATRPSSPAPDSKLATSPVDDLLDPSAPPPLQAEALFRLTGCTSPRARLTIDDHEVPVDGDTGRFEWGTPVANGRSVFPLFISEGNRQLRGLLAVEVNLRLLSPEPVDDD